MANFCKRHRSVAIALIVAATGGAHRSEARTPAAPASVPSAPGGAASATLDHRVFTLPNGLTVLVHTDRSTPSVYIGMWYRTGSKDEGAGRSGYAHLFEHLMFQPTPHRDDDFVAAMTRAGATDVNGNTTTDRTFYHATVPTGSLDVALWLESDRMAYLADGITQAMLDEQRGVVKNEKMQGDLQPGTLLDEVMTAGYYPHDHPYGHTVIGSMADLDRASVDDAKRWFTDYYGASNAVLVLSGDIDEATARDKVTRYFGAVRPGRTVPQVRQWVPGYAAVRRDSLVADVPAASIIRRWPLPADDARRNTLLQLVARTLAGSSSAFLQRRLVEERRVALGVTAGVSDDLIDNAFNLTMTVAPGIAPDVAGRALDAALSEYFAAGPDPQRLAAVVAATDIALLRSGESSAAIGNWMVEGYVRHGDPAFFLKQREWIARPDPVQLRELARAWLERPYYEAVMRPAAAWRATGTDVDRSRPPAPGPTDDAIPFPPVTQMALANGMKLVVAERHRLPLVDMSMQFATGSAADAGHAPGAAAAAFRAMVPDDADAAAARIGERIGFRPTIAVGERRSGIDWSATTRNLDASFRLAAAAIRRTPTAAEKGPATPATDPGAGGAPMRTSRDPMAAAEAIYTTAMWGKGHPRAGIVAPDAVRPVPGDVAARFRARGIGPDIATLYMIGDVTPAQARAMAERYFGDWSPVRAPALPDTPPPAGVAGRVILVDAPGARQSRILVGGMVGPATADTAAAEALTNAALTGDFDSRLNAGLRSKGWTYGISGGIADTPAGPRLLTIGGLVQSDRTGASMAEIRREITDFVSTRPITAEELARSRLATVRSVQAGFGTNAAYLAAMIGAADYGQAPDRAAGTARRLNATGLDEVRRVAARTYRPADLTWVIVGDLGTIEADVRALGFGPVEIWSVDGHKLR